MWLVITSLGDAVGHPKDLTTMHVQIQILAETLPTNTHPKVSIVL